MVSFFLSAQGLWGTLDFVEKLTQVGLMYLLVSFLYCISKDVIKSWPSKHLLVFKTSWRRLQEMSWRRLQHVFSVTILRLSRRLEDVLKTPWRHLARRLEDVLKICLGDILKKYLEDTMETNKILGISVSNKPKCVFNKSVFHKSISDNSKTNPKCLN